MVSETAQHLLRAVEFSEVSETTSRWIQQQKQRRDDGWLSDKNNRNHDDISSLDVNLDTQMSATDHVRFAYTAWR
ncbi:hypothetical protein DPMN_136602 [Dreissena polymorpha]|uniref:Uncharacterized protein n=1 Tax=Dreissena polymorpha TaxID=45954 RepID=A0A9D4JFP3_DREPO|nr:hypothetical protein DPMN_136602 [Dreissena polymorpha]